LIQSNQKSSHQKCFFAARGFYPANQSEPRVAIILPHFVRLIPDASAKTCYAPATAQARIVLPNFARSLSADREEELFCLIANSLIQ